MTQGDAHRYCSLSEFIFRNIKRQIFSQIIGYKYGTVCAIKLKIVSGFHTIINACAKFNWNRLRNVEEYEIQHFLNDFVWQIRGYNSTKVSPIKLKIVSCTPPHPNACMCKLSLKSVGLNIFYSPICTSYNINSNTYMERIETKANCFLSFSPWHI